MEKYRDSRSIGSLDNSAHDVKRQLRGKYMQKVGASLCFDLFCGHGTYCRELYRDHFAEIICVDKKADALSDIPGDDHIHAYKGDNAKLILGLLDKYGWPDLWDLDAYGNPDAALHRALKWPRVADTFAVVATDGTFLSRKRNCTIPAHWGFGKGLRWAPFASGRVDYPLIVRDNLQRWFAETGHELAEFEAHLPYGQSVVYWAALAQKSAPGGA